MFRNYIKVALNNMVRRKIYSAINILGLGIGLTVTILILLFVHNEFSYDTFHKNEKNLYRVFTNFHKEDGSIDKRSKGVALPMGPKMEEYFPEITGSTRFLQKYATLKAQGKLYQERITLVDKPFFRIFSFPLIMGSADSVFAQPNSVVLTEDYAKKLFGDVEPMGKTLTLVREENQTDFMVTGIAAKAPDNSSISFNILINMDTAETLKLDKNFENWGAFGFMNYVLVKDTNSMDSLANRLPSFTQQYYGSLMEEIREIEKWKNKTQPLFSFGFQKLARVHLDPEVKGSLNLNAIFILTAIAFIVLLIACINFMNLSIGQTSARSLEVGIRKVLGAERKQLIHQFWGESVVTTVVSLPVSFLLTALVLPTFNRFADTNLEWRALFQPVNLLALLILVVLVGIVSGSYPALVMSRFQPLEILKGRLSIRGKNLGPRIMVVVQFALSIVLIVSAIVMGRQINYMLTRDPGFNKEGVVVIRVREATAEKSNEFLRRFRDRLNRHPQILGITGVSHAFGDPASFSIEKDGREIEIYQSRVDYDFFKTLDIDVLQGRAFSPEFSTDVQNVVVNEKLIKELNIKNPIGKPLEGYYKAVTIIGVVRDYNAEDFRHGITPLMHHMNPAWKISYIMVRIAPGSVASSLSLLQDTWRGLQPNKAFIHSFLDENLETNYKNEKRWSSIIKASTVLALLIACMGVFGLTSISIDRKTKEIGIRKVLGASVPQIIYLLMKEFIWLVGIANIISWPIAYYTMRSLLDNYYYRISLGFHYFVLAGVLSLVIGMVTIFFLATRAALANPVDSLQYE